MEFGLLGPVELTGEAPGVGHAPRAAKLRVVLAALLMRAGEVVSAGTLIDELWPTDPPRTATTTLQVYVSQLRKVLRAADPDHGPGTLLTRPPGYTLQLGRARLDVTEFERLHARGRAAEAAGDPAGAAEHHRRALALWRGPLAADTPHGPLLEAAAVRLAETRAAALDARLRAELALGRHHELVAELGELAAGQPLREELHGQLMLALYRCGRQAEALEAYARLRRTLVADLAIEPGPHLQHLHHRILTADPTLLDAAPTEAAARHATGGKAQNNRPPTPKPRAALRPEPAPQHAGRPTRQSPSGPGKAAERQHPSGAARRPAEAVPYAAKPDVDAATRPTTPHATPQDGYDLPWWATDPEPPAPAARAGGLPRPQDGTAWPGLGPWRAAEPGTAALVGAVSEAYAAGLWSSVVRLADALTAPVEAGAAWPEWARTHTLALDAARRSGDRDAEARMLRSLGDLAWQQGRPATARTHYEQALLTAHHCGAYEEHGRALAALADLHLDEGSHARARELLDQALAQCPGPGRARFDALRATALLALEEGDTEASARCFEQARQVARALGEQRLEAYARRAARAAAEGSTRHREVRPGIWRLREPARHLTPTARQPHSGPGISSPHGTRPQPVGPEQSSPRGA
ncbi:BTAD domain-containing putative transcriptional regulator [Streptomyces sp. NPDC046876]|uniref:BTAD domain-containing putative transcriptional regulator n=1 Tax=Streptomyces sp. NPDC046876 TaxID=3155616 RepID=UPI0033E84021